MKTLTALHPTPLHITETTPWTKTHPVVKYNHCEIPSLGLRTQRLNAGAKGFNGTSSSEKAQQLKNKEKFAGTKNEEEDEKIPQVVFERMITRILFHVGMPLVTGFALLQIFSALKKQELWDVPVWLPFLTSFMTFGSSALGVAYGTLSTSWDAEEEGSLLGFAEAQKNWTDMWKEGDGK